SWVRPCRRCATISRRSTALEVRADGTASGSTERRLILAGASRGRAGGPGAGDRYALMTALSQVRSSASYDFARRPAQYAKSGRQIGLRWRRAPPSHACLLEGGRAGVAPPNISVSREPG